MKPTDRIGTRERHLRQDANGSFLEPVYRLRVVKGVDIDKSMVLEGAAVVGSGEEANFQLRDGAVSRMHVELVPKSDGVMVRDLGSTNGTFVGALKVQSVQLEKTATLQVGHTQLEVSCDFNLLPLEPSAGFGRLVGSSASMQHLYSALARVAPSDARVLLFGETGVGKELVAEAIHQNSARSDKPFVVFDCGAVSAELVESDLFGHHKGAFTGAKDERKGAFLEADGGTLFIDEIAELPLELQPRLLRAVESGRIKAIGSDAFRHIDVRVISATHHDLEAAVKRGTFRADLYFRLAVISVTIPPLRQRIDDLQALVARFCENAGKQLDDLSPSFLAECQIRAWPGNVRELKHAVERELFSTKPSPVPGVAPSALPFKEAKAHMVDRFTREYLQRLLKENHGNVSEVARASGLARPYVHELLTKLGLVGS